MLNKKGKRLIMLAIAIIFLIIAFSYLQYILVAFIIAVILKMLMRYSGNVRVSRPANGPRAAGAVTRAGSSKYLEWFFAIAIIIAVLYFLGPYILKMGQNVQIPDFGISGKGNGPLNSVIYVESQEGAGIVVNNGTYGIQLATGAAKNGTTFRLRTIKNTTGWPSFGADVFASKGNATLKVSYVDIDIPSASIHFKKILVPTEKGVRYSNKYKLDNYRAYAENRSKKSEIDNTRLANGENPPPPNHDIVLEVYVAPNSYVELSNMQIIRNW